MMAVVLKSLARDVPDDKDGTSAEEGAEVRERLLAGHRIGERDSDAV